MMKYLGKPVHGGTVAGKVFVLRKGSREAEYGKAPDISAEIERVQSAAGQAKEQLEALAGRALCRAGEEGAAIFAAQGMILEDQEYLGAIYEVIQRENAAAEYAVAVTGEAFAGRLAAMEDDLLKARAADVRDVSDRLLGNLGGSPDRSLQLKEPAIVAAEDLTPGEVMQMDREKVLAFVTAEGSANSHTAILARLMDIPAVAGVPVELAEIRSGMRAVADGSRGEVVFEPDEAFWEEAEGRMIREREDRRLLQELKGKENVTKDGRKVQVCANIGGAGDLAAVLESDAGGIGLFRSEFLYLGRESFPSEEEQFQAYRQVIQAMGDKRVVIRTLDIGADKGADYFRLEREENPALGCRGIRVCLRRPDIFKTQLRALLRASAYGNAAIMYPMITSVREMERIQEILEEAGRELDQERVPYRYPRQGIMIETPAAVMLSDRLAELADFFSIGTNDLTQYALAIDRQNGELEDFYDPCHEAVLRMVRMAADNAHKHGKWVGICGDLAADLDLTESFVDMGVDELSVPAAMVLPLRRRIRELG